MSIITLSEELNERFLNSYDHLVDAYTVAIDYISLLEEKPTDPIIASETHPFNLYIVKQDLIKTMLKVLDDIGVPLEIPDELIEKFDSREISQLLTNLLHSK